ncbi:MAG: LTA synthase family protein [Planctomycetota bacterium]|jgi:phosphoglycerol transferase MdoB-like AlkP superfamily enzyme
MANCKALGNPASGALRGDRTGAAIAALMSQRVRPLLLLAAAGWVLFACFRAGLLIASHDELGNVGAAEIVRCLLTGVRYDSVPIAYAMFPLGIVLAMVPPSAFTRRGFRRMIVAYAVIVTALAIFVEIVGAAFFLHFGARLNSVSMDYFGHFRELAVYIWNAYPIWLLMIGLFAAGWVMYRVFGRVFWVRRRPVKSILVRVLQASILTALCVLGARGGLDEQPLRSGEAYFSENNVVNQVTLNNFYTFWNAAMLRIEDNIDESELYPLPGAVDAAETTAAMVLLPSDTPLPAGPNALWRRAAGVDRRGDYNVVVIVMEGMAGNAVGALGNAQTQTPNLDKLCEQGLFFERMYAVGQRTNRGLIGVLCGHPDLTGQSILKRDRSQASFLTLPGIFRERGYRTMFFYGGDPNFDNMKRFFGTGGIQQFIGLEQMRNRGVEGNWGMPDEIIFSEAHETFKQLGDERFFSVILTVSNHEPYDVPLDRTKMHPHDTEENRRSNAYRYADWSLGEFFGQARNAEYFKRTIFVLVADHGRDWDRTQIIDAPGYRVPALIYAPGIVPAGRVSTVTSQTDLPPTLLALLGGSYEHCFFGRNVLDVPSGEGFALLHCDESLAFVRGNRALVLPPRQSPKLFEVDGDAMHAIAPELIDAGEVARLQDELLSYYQTARQVYLTRTYRRCTPARTGLALAQPN